ncbi:MAG TPA: hypothetical protein VEK08_17990 [Planctomycetota bacterium]|nr:hypothetical protein [Planctomycetota bacterium]
MSKATGSKTGFLTTLYHPLAMSAMLAAMVVVMLHACWRAPFYNIDDEFHIKPGMVGSWKDWFRFRPEFSVPYIPVTFFSYTIDLTLFGEDQNKPEAREEEFTAVNPYAVVASETMDFPVPSAHGMRIMNGVYQVIAGLLLYLFLRRIHAGSGLAAVVALVWTGHPMALESVAWIAERKNVLAGMFGIATLLAWTAGRHHHWRWPLVYLLYGLAVLSKPSALGVLPVLIGLELFDPQRNEFRFTRIRDWLALTERMAVPVIISIAGSWATLKSVTREITLPPGGTIWTALLTDVEIFARYIENILVPVNLSFFYGVDPIVSLADTRLWIYGAFLLGICGGSIWAAGPRYRALALLGVFWFFGALGPNANIVGIPFWMQDRYVYLSTAGMLLAVGAGIAGIAARFPSDKVNLPRIAWLWPLGIAALCGARSPLFTDTDKLSLDAVQRQPGSAMARLCAAQIFKYRFHLHSMNGATPDRAKADAAARTLAQIYEGIETCADIWAHVDPFTLRVKKSELLPLLGRLDEVEKTLGPVPPQDMEMLSGYDAKGQWIMRDRRAKIKGYPPKTLAIAWGVLGETHLRRTALPGMQNEQRIAHARKALQFADESINVQVRDFEAYILKGRALFRLADLHAEKNDMENAMKIYQEGVKVLKSVPSVSLSHKAARQGLDLVTPPKPPAAPVPQKQP